MNGALLEAFRHDNWATRELLTFCRGLSHAQLASAATGTYGDIPATFDHIILADGRYLWRLAGDAPAWAVNRQQSTDLAELESRARELGPLWEDYLKEPIDAERVIVVDEGANEVRAGVFVAQALHHGSAHREQICAVVTGLGLEPPNVQAWGYAEATGRIWPRRAESS